MIVTHEQLQKFKTSNTRTIELPDGSSREVRMTPGYWREVEFLRVVEGISASDMAAFALEEMELQPVTFDEAYRMIVAHLANRWKA